MRSPALLVAAAVVLTAPVAAAQTFVECPPGSYRMDERGFSWCQPTVCENDSMCNPNVVCRPVGLCMQLGALSKPGEPDGGARLMVTQICGEDRTCPQNQTCSVHGRCVTPTQAEKLGVMDKKVGAPPAPSAAPEPTETKKSSCGCEAVGAGGRGGAGLFGVALGLSALLVRAGRRGSRRRAR